MKNKIMTTTCKKCHRNFLIDVESFLEQHQRNGFVNCVECSTNLSVSIDNTSEQSQYYNGGVGAFNKDRPF